jgi:dTDP-4-amino-4,6-dideoxygalactose transaminase
VSDKFLPYALPDIGDTEIEAVAEALRSGWVTTGPISAAFEDEFVTFVGGGVEAIAVNSATAGLHLALEALGIGSGDEVVVPTWTFTATAEVVRYLGAIPVIVDIDEKSLNIDLDALRAALTPRTRAVVVVHFAGLSVNMLELRRALDGYDRVKVVEDAAHALPSQVAGIMVGSVKHSDAAVFSFYANKTMTTGEGGIVTTRDSAIAKRMRVMRLHGIDRDVFDRYSSNQPSWFYDVVAPGYKYNLPDPAAALGRVQLGRVSAMRDARATIAATYLDCLSDLPVDLPQATQGYDIHAWHVFLIRLRGEARMHRDEFVRVMAQDKSIGTSVHFIPLHRLTYWREFLSLTPERFPNAEKSFPQAVSLPIFSRMTTEDTGRVVSAVRELLSR